MRRSKPIPEGTVFGRLTVVSNSLPREGVRYHTCLCQCECGNQKSVRVSSLNSGCTKSCGCLQSEVASKKAFKHGLSNHPVYDVWRGMHYRCYNTSGRDYKHYGGRGISVCQDWHDDDGLRKFIEDMYPTFSEGLEIDRIDVDGGYSKDNCRWATRREQVINRRTFGRIFDTHYIEYDGKKLCMSVWAEEVSIPVSALGDRITKLGWDVGRALTEPLKVRKVKFDISGRTFEIKDIFKSPPNVYLVSKHFKIKAHDYVAILLGSICKTEAYLGKEWTELPTPKGLDRSKLAERSVPILTEEARSHLTSLGWVAP